jgi:hypothetical protein
MHDAAASKYARDHANSHSCRHVLRAAYDHIERDQHRDCAHASSSSKHQAEGSDEVDACSSSDSSCSFSVADSEVWVHQNLIFWPVTGVHACTAGVCSEQGLLAGNVAAAAAELQLALFEAASAPSPDRKGTDDDFEKHTRALTYLPWLRWCYRRVRISMLLHSASPHS